MIKRLDDFRETIRPFVEIYGRDMCNAFYAYWSEPNKSKTKFRAEQEKTWDVARRLERWQQNETKLNNKSNGKQPTITSDGKDARTVAFEEQAARLLRRYQAEANK